ncbi:S-adenosyl-L-methionine-dependent methyltransferase [Vararia minispora EC-137]|uniref:S-adenosyl-L-methionine-dependent methyltransferase n=1 Tax=Vararia minispora EC-137 TaxID=1314806 RepID=A0ACB8QYM5_9AGAM|nr:S-adenosyl-L-methionine-dependent methyltransferase [Vararia minispora EC-137]
MSSDTSDVESVNSIYGIEELGLSLIEAVLSRQSCDEVQKIIDAGAPTWYQDEDGWSALHAAAHIEDQSLVLLLLQEGAVWNAVDNLGNSAGDIALSLNNETCYTLIRDAGVRKELILQLLSAHGDNATDMDDNAILLKSIDHSALGSVAAFLSSKLRYTTDVFGQEICLLQTGDTEIGVMMGWEREIMQETVQKLCTDQKGYDSRLKVLNVGFGLGIIDSFFQELPAPPALHVIIEPHRDVLQYMRDNGWYGKPGVEILEGKWQDFIGTDKLSQFSGFDAIYTDTFSENYEDLYKFFKHVPNLLARPEGRFSFFNGLGATNAVFYDVYTKLAEINLTDLGFDVSWHDVDVEEKQSVGRWGRTREYFSLKLFRLPICHLKL